MTKKPGHDKIYENLNVSPAMILISSLITVLAGRSMCSQGSSFLIRMKKLATRLKPLLGAHVILQCRLLFPGPTLLQLTSSRTNEPGHEKMCLMLYENNKGADQPAHPRRLISAFVVRCLDSIISLDSIAEILRLYLASMAAQAGLSLAWSETPEDTFSYGVAQIHYSVNDTTYLNFWLKTMQFRVYF